MRVLPAVVLLGAGGAATAAPPTTISGTVVEAQSRWTDDHSRIITEATIQTASGLVVVSQLGGTVDGIGMITIPGPPILEPGMAVTAQVQQRVDLSNRMHMTLDGVKVIATPPSFVRTGPTKAGSSLHWESGCAFVTTDSAGTTAIAGDQEFAVVDASIDTWNDATASCAAPHLINEGRRAVEVNARDRTNVIKFRDTSWCRPATAEEPQRCYLPESAGITTATYVNDGGDRDGAIVDADIEINGVDFAIAVSGQTLATGKDCISDLQNTLTHELGHLQGLEHVCLAPRDPPRVDDEGMAVPSCSATTDPAILDSTMFPFQECGETKKASLAADDIAAMCALFPKSSPGTCEPVGAIGGGCCGVGGDPAGPITLAGLLTLWWRRKNRPSARREYSVPA